MSIHGSSIIHPNAEIDDDVFIGPFCTVGESVKISSGTKLISHVVLKGPTSVGKNNTFYQFCTIGHQFCQIGDFSFAGMNTSITMDVPAFIKVASNPARVVGLNSVGMERGGIDSDTINTLKKAYKIIYRKGLNLKDAIKKIESMKCDHKEISVLVDSLKSSKRGILR